MGLETGTYISDLDTANPDGATDLKSEGDDHIRLLKTTIKNTFPNINGAVNPTPTELNYSVGVTSALQTQINGKQDSDQALTDISALAVTDGNFIVGDGANFVAESGSTARASIGIDGVSGNIVAGDLNQTGGSEAVTQATIRDAAVGQAQLKSTTASQSTNVIAGNSATVSLTGGNYTMGWYTGGGNHLRTCAHASTYVAQVSAYNTLGIDDTLYVYSRYVQASPPWNLGNGDIALFVMAKINKTTGEILATEIAPDPHWAYHGPHDLHPHYGKLQKAAGLWGVDVRSAITTDTLARTDVASKLKKMKAIRADPDLFCEALSYEFTMEEKNIDMNVVPHSFGPLGADEMVVLVDPAGSITDQLGILHDGMSDAQTGSISDLLHGGYIKIGTSLNAITPKGVVAVSASWKNTK